MKLFNKYTAFSVLASSLLLTACSDLDSVPEGDVMTENQLNTVANADANKMQAKVNGLYSSLINEGIITSWYGSERHFDFGYAAACMMYDASGMDEPSENNGFNWFGNNMDFSDRTTKSPEGYFLWLLYYNHIKVANDIISASSDTTNTSMRYALGQAYASRAFDYLNLIQMYQFTYKGHESAAGVPIVKEDATLEENQNNPRATVAQVYAYIMNDLNESIRFLDGFSRSAKNAIDQQVAYGLRARANLLMQNWADAAADADAAAVGYEPLSETAAAAPGFNDITATDWIWGSAVSEKNSIVTSGIVNFPSMMCSFTGNGYAPMYAGRYINSTLYDEIDSTDVRKGWWLNADLYSPIVDYTWSISDQEGTKNAPEWFEWKTPYLNVKFGPYKNIYNNSTNACDLPIMRVEEMLLIKAEGLAMSGKVDEGKTVLENFVRNYRDPAYTCTATTAEGVQDAIWFQRRIELWGEGFSFFDMMRLKKGLNRKNSNYDVALRYNLPAESQIFLWIIPEDEINNNAALKDANNPIVARPTAN